MHDLRLKTSIQPFDAFVRCMPMGNQPWPQFKNGIRERSIVQCDFGPIYTITNTQRIRSCPGKLKFILVKISTDSGRLHGKHAKENQTLFTFFTTENFSVLCSHECKYGTCSDLPSNAVNLSG